MMKAKSREAKAEKQKRNEKEKLNQTENQKPEPKNRQDIGNQPWCPQGHMRRPLFKVETRADWETAQTLQRLQITYQKPT